MVLHGRNVAIVGTAFSDVARRSDRSLASHVVQACLGALDDCGLSVDEVDGVANYPNPSRPVGAVVEGVDVAGVNFVARVLGLHRLRWAVSVSHGTTAAALVEAVNAVSAGAADCVLVWRAMFNPPGRFGRLAGIVADGPDQFTHPYGLAHNVTVFAMPFSRYLSKYGKTREDLAAYITMNRQGVVDDETSVFFGQPLTTEDYAGARIVAPPVSLYDCDMPVTGCGAFVVCSAERAKDLRQKPAYVAGKVSLGLPGHNSAILQYEHLAESGRHLGKTLWRDSGLGPTELDLANLYDGFSFWVPLWSEWLGLCAEGEGIDYVCSTDRIPINTGGGALGRGRLHGTPQIIEAVRQLQGRSRHQVTDPRVALAEVGAPSHGAGAVVLTSDEPSP